MCTERHVHHMCKWQKKKVYAPPLFHISVQVLSDFLVSQLLMFKDTSVLTLGSDTPEHNLTTKLKPLCVVVRDAVAEEPGQTKRLLAASMAFHFPIV